MAYYVLCLPLSRATGVIIFAYVCKTNTYNVGSEGIVWREATFHTSENLSQTHYLFYFIFILV